MQRSLPWHDLSMKKFDVIASIGSVTAVAKLLGISHQAVSKWPETVPMLQQYRLRELKPRAFPRPSKQAHNRQSA